MKKREAAKKASYSPAPMSAAAKTKTRAAAAMKAGRMTDSAVSAAKSDAIKKAAKAKIQRQVGKVAPIKPAKASKSVPKKPTGELPKRNSALAKFIKGSASGKGFTQAEARTAAGKFQDMANAKGGSFRSLDASGLALGKAEAATKAMRKPAAKTKPASKNPMGLKQMNFDKKKK
jgi:hypothetical protein